MSYTIVLFCYFCCCTAITAQEPTLLWGRGAHAFSITGVSYSSDGSELYCVSSVSRAIFRHDAQSGLLKGILHDDEMVIGFDPGLVDFSGDGRYVAYTTIRGEVVWKEMPSGRLLHRFSDPQKFIGINVRCSQNGQYLATL